MRSLRIAGAALVTGLVLPVSLVVGTALPASAGSSLSNPLNVLAATADAAEYARLAAQLGVSQSPEVAEYEARMAATATTASVGASGVEATRGTGGRIGMVLNTVAVLSGVAFLWPGGDDAPELPMPPATEVATGSPSVGWTNYPGAAVASCGGSCVSLTVPAATTTVRKRNWTSAEGASWSTWSAWITAGGTGGSSSAFSQVAYATRVIFALGSTPPTTDYTGVYWLVMPPVGGTIANPSPGTATDPAVVPRYIDSQINCKAPGGGFEVVTGRAGPFTFDPAQPYAMPEVPDLECPEGTWLDSGTRVLDTPGATAPDVPLMEPYDAPDWVEQQATDYPECFPVGALQCQLKLFKNATGTAPEYDCHAYVAGSANPCLDWRTDPNRTDRYTCRFGATDVLLRKCNPYADLWTTGVLTPTPNPDVDVDPPVGVDPTPEATPDLGNCVPNWSELLNPWWVFKATSCALVWAFVPATLPPFGDIPSPLPAGWFPTLPSWEAGSCGPLVMPSFTLGPLVGQVGSTQLFDTCDQPWPIARNVTYFGTLALITIRIAGRAFRAVMQALGMAVDYTQGGDDK